jgi:hypothetical protein
LRDPRQLRSRWIAQLSQAADRYLRSTFFLESMRLGLLVLTDVHTLPSRVLQLPLGARGRALPSTARSGEAVSGSARTKS